MAFSWIRSIKMMVMSFVSIYASISMWTAAIDTFGRKTEFTTTKPTKRCVSVMDKAEKFGKDHNATTVAYFLAAGRYKFGFCTDESVATMDEEFGAGNMYDPLKDATNNKCDLTDAKFQTDRETQCRISGMPAGTTCQSILQTAPTPYGVAWKFSIAPLGNSTAPIPPPGPNQTAPPISPTAAKPCAAKYELNAEMPPCAYARVRFYFVENKWVSALFICASLLNIGLWFYEGYCCYQFSNTYGDRYADLKLLITPNDNNLGSLFAFTRRYIFGRNHLGDEPEPKCIEFTINVVADVLAQMVAVIAIVGCNLDEHLQMMVLAVIMSLKLVVDIGLKAKEFLCPKPPTEEELNEYAKDVPRPTGIDYNLNNVVMQVVRAPNIQTLESVMPQIDASPAKFPYKYCLAKLCKDGLNCIPAEQGRLRAICQNEDVDAACYNEILTWLMLLSQIQSVMAGTGGIVPRSYEFPTWRMKHAPKLAPDEQFIPQAEPTASGGAETGLLQIPQMDAV